MLDFLKQLIILKSMNQIERIILVLILIGFVPAAVYIGTTQLYLYMARRDFINQLQGLSSVINHDDPDFIRYCKGRSDSYLCGR